MSTAVATEHNSPAQILDENVTPAAVSPANLVGTWNGPSGTQNLVRIVIAAAGSGITVHAYGACSPTPCDWGAVSGLAYSANVSSPAAVAFTAQYKFSFSQVTVVGHIVGRQLLVETFTHFTDKSGRDDYYNAETMVR